MRAGRLGIARPAIPARNAVLLFRVGPFQLGIEASALQEIRNAWAAGSKELASAAILSARALLGVPSGPEERLIVLRGGSVAILVDSVDRMLEVASLRPLPRAFRGAECAWYRGLALAGETVFPVFNPDALARAAREQVTKVLTPVCVPQDLSRESVAS